ncbi:MAG: SUMF1/EgtB/PvdO family nonheme iron enzyme [bacterium]|nr:SUMF1/EgtB/PvdO family nonheme iron enzyme [bacterium]
MDPVPFLIAPLTKKVTDALLAAAGRRLRRVFEDPERTAALERSSEAGILAMVQAAPAASEDERAHFHDVVKEFFTCEEIAEDLAKALAPLLGGQPLDLAEMEELFVAAGFDPETLPGFDVRPSFTAFAGGFAAAVLEQPVLREELNTHVLLSQLELQTEMRDLLREIAAFVTEARPGSAVVSAGEITAETIAGTRIFLHAPALQLPPAPVEDWEPLYLRTLIHQCDALDLTPIDEAHPSGLGAGERGTVRLSDVFTTLYLAGVRRRPSESVAEAFAHPSPERPLRGEDDDKLQPITAVEAAAAVPRLVVLGRPGGGKSTLVNHLVVQLAKRRHGMAVDPGVLPGWREDASPLPVRILLRRFAGWLPATAVPDAGLVWDYLEHQLERVGCRDAFAGLHRTLTREGGAVFFDGLDEVHEDDARRKRSLICGAIERFAEPLDQCRVVVTCREYAYRRDDDAWCLPKAAGAAGESKGEDGFTEVTLAPFNLEQVRAFTRTWYRMLGRSKGWDEERCDDEAGHLAAAVAGWPHLRDLAESPLLLTLMAQIHGRDGYLPRDRADLYERTVNLLLAHWENRLVRDLRGGAAGVEHDQVLRLDLKIGLLRSALEKVAFEAHERQEQEGSRDEGAADIPGGELLDALDEQLGSLDRARQVIAYVQQRAGLLQAVDQRTYRFPHRTFQEYLAARYLLKQAEYDGMLRERVRRDLPWWREVFLLAAGSSRETPRVVSDLVDELVPRPPQDRVTSEQAEEARLAAQALDETGFAGRIAKEDRRGRFAATLERIRDWLLAGVKAIASLDPLIRARCGSSLADVGDPRPEATTVEGMELCLVPGGPFWMGSDDRTAERPQHLNEHLDYDFWIARYPVTVAQFSRYLDANCRKPGDARALTGPDNAPVVCVSWHEARDFCRWLAASLSEEAALPAGWDIRLPSEAEWEKAARGGLEIPSAPVVRKVTESSTAAFSGSISLVPNPEPKRIYPWLGGFEVSRCNVWESGIHTVSTVGCFFNGRSVYGCEEMSGNILEWTRSQHRSYPYDSGDGREKPDKSVIWVLRGGAFNDLEGSVRCAVRLRLIPGSRYGGVGFRVVFSSSSFL